MTATISDTADANNEDQRQRVHVFYFNSIPSGANTTNNNNNTNSTNSTNNTNNTTNTNNKKAGPCLLVFPKMVAKL